MQWMKKYSRFTGVARVATLPAIFAMIKMRKHPQNYPLFDKKKSGFEKFEKVIRNTDCWRMKYSSYPGK